MANARGRGKGSRHKGLRSFAPSHALKQLPTARQNLQSPDPQIQRPHAFSGWIAQTLAAVPEQLPILT